MNKHRVVFRPGELYLEVLAGQTLMEVINESGLQTDFLCGGRGTCGKCRVRILDGIGQPTDSEKKLLDAKELQAGIRLACQTRVYTDMSVEIPNNEKLKHNILIASQERSFSLEPHLQKISFQVDKPSLADQRSDWQRLKDGLVQEGLAEFELEDPLSLLRQVPQAMRRANYSLTAVQYKSKISGIDELDTTGTMLGMAFDIGTTTIVGYLLDLYTGKERCIVSTLNPQTKFGADVISRITFAGQEDGLNKLHQAVIGAINQLIGEAVDMAGVSRQAIYGVSVAANTTMHHLFLGVNPQNVAVSPYVAAIDEPLVLSPMDLNIKINQAGKIFVLPNIAGFVGADTTAVLVATELDKSEHIKLIIDIGTNGEIALGSKKKIVTCSAAAGPAFEGAQISSGMRGAAGAIDHITFGEELQYTVIGGIAPRGICGSALLDAVAGLLELGLIDKRGKFVSLEKLTDGPAAVYKDRLVIHEGATAFLLADANTTSTGRPILITQGDIRELQLAKGAMAAGIRILIESLGIQVEDIEEVLLAGAFGNYLNPRSACLIGLIPRELENRIKLIGNAAGTGAKLALLSSHEFHSAAHIAKFSGHVELGSYPNFTNIFGKSMYFNPKKS